MRYGYIGYTQVVDGGRISFEKILKRKVPVSDIKLSKQIKSLMSTALFQTNESIWRMSPAIPSGMTKLPPARPKGIVEAPTLLASRLSDIFYTKNAEYLLNHFDELDLDKLARVGKISRSCGASWQPIYDLVADDPAVHIKLIKRLLKVWNYPVAENFSTVFCFALVGLKKYKGLVAACPKLLRPYLCLLPATIKEHTVAMSRAKKRTFLRVALNVRLFVDKVSKKNPKLPKELKIAYRDVKETWGHYYAGKFVPLCMLGMAHLSLLPSLTKRCNVVIYDFNPLDGEQYAVAKPKPKPAPLPVKPKKPKSKKKVDGIPKKKKSKIKMTHLS